MLLFEAEKIKPGAISGKFFSFINEHFNNDDQKENTSHYANQFFSNPKDNSMDFVTSFTPGHQVPVSQ